MSHVQDARAYERNYHETLYNGHGLFEAGTWLQKPAPYALESFGLVPSHDGIRVLDLGAGVGRHAIPAAKYFGPTSTVECVDLLSSAVRKLRENAVGHGVASQIIGTVTDVETHKLQQPYDLVLSVSCVEHIPTKTRLIRFIERLQTATSLGGVHCFMIMTNNEWLRPDTNERLVPLVEQNLTQAETSEMLQHLYSEWDIHDLSAKDWRAAQVIHEEEVVLKSTCLQFTAQK